MVNTNSQSKTKVAALVTGTYREIEFILKLWPYMAGSVDYDLYLVLRHVYTQEKGRIGTYEADFNIGDLVSCLGDRCFICELPSIDTETAMDRYLVPVGPTTSQRECGMLSMFWGVFTGISMIKSSLRCYSHVIKTRTDYLPWVAPWISGMLDLYNRSDQKIIVDGVVTKPRRYPDRLDIPWQGSINDAFTFASYEQFLQLWDIEQILPKLWTGIPETTLFRAAMWRFTGDDLQSHRRNETLLKKFFFWEPNETNQSFYLLREAVLPDVSKEMILHLLEDAVITNDFANGLLRSTYDFIMSIADVGNVERLVSECLNTKDAAAYLKACYKAKENLASEYKQSVQTECQKLPAGGKQ